MNVSYVVNVTGQTALLVFRGCLRKHFFMSMPGDSEHTGNCQPIVLHESNKYSVVFYKKSVVGLWFQKSIFFLGKTGRDFQLYFVNKKATETKQMRPTQPMVWFQEGREQGERDE